MLVFVLAVLGSLFLLTLLGLTLNSFLFQRTRSQDKADALALELASKINAGDRVGQMNELEARSRELVFVSRQRVQDCQNQNLEFLSPLCEQLLLEAREGHAKLERERLNQISQICKELRESALAYNDAAQQKRFFKIAWLSTEEPVVSRVDLGSIANVPSNARSAEAVPDLAAFDTQRQFCLGPSRLYRANIDAQLPVPDSDLAFKISGLAPNINGTCSPVRNVNTDVFQFSGTIIDQGESKPCHLDHIPTAVQVFCEMKTAVGLKKDLQANVEILSPSAPNGAMAGVQ